jgi:hypothetical protein
MDADNLKRMPQSAEYLRRMRKRAVSDSPRGYAQKKCLHRYAQLHFLVKLPTNFQLNRTSSLKVAHTSVTDGM